MKRENFYFNGGPKDYQCSECGGDFASDLKRPGYYCHNCLVIAHNSCPIWEHKTHFPKRCQMCAEGEL